MVENCFPLPRASLLDQGSLENVCLRKHKLLQPLKHSWYTLSSWLSVCVPMWVCVIRESGVNMHFACPLIILQLRPQF